MGNGGTALIYAAGKGNKAIVQLLLEKSADVTAKTISGKSAQDLARKQGHDEIAQLLQEYETKQIEKNVEKIKVVEEPKVVERPKSMITFRRANFNFKPQTEKYEEVIINEIKITSSADSIKHHFLVS